MSDAMIAVWETSGWSDAGVGVAAIHALRDDWASQERLRELALTGEPVAIREAALLAVALAPSSLPVLRHGVTAAQREVRAASVAGLRADPLARPMAAHLLASDPSCGVRAVAATLLAGDPRYTPALRRALEAPLPSPEVDPEASQLEGALVRALVREPAVIEQVKGRLVGLASDVRDVVLEDLWARPEQRPYVRALLAHEVALIRASAARALRRDPESASSLLDLAAGDPSPLVRAAAVSVLGFDAVAWQVRAGRLADASEHASVRVAIVETMRAGEEEIIRALLSDPSPTLRGVAASALRDDAASVDARRALLDDAEPFVRARVVSSLARQEALFDSVMPCLGDPDPHVRRAAIEVLGRYPPAIPLLRRYIDAPSPVGPVAMQALRDDPGSLPLLRARLRPAQRVERRRRLRDLARDPSSVAGVRALLDDPDVLVQADAASALGDAGEEAIVRRLDDPDPRWREVATRAVAAAAKAREALLQRLGDGDGAVRAAAAEALSGDEAAAPRVRELLDEPSAAVRAAAITALARDAGSVERIAAMLDEPSDMDGDPAQLAAARAIAGRPEHASQLRAIVERGDYAAEVTRVALESLAPAGAPAEPLLGMLDDVQELDALRIPAARLLWAQGQHRGAVIARMDDPSPALRAAVLELLGDDASAVDLARARLRDSDARVRAAAAAALRRRAPTDRGVALVELVEEMGLATGGRLHDAPIPSRSRSELCLDGDPRKDDVLAWLCARLASDERGGTIAASAEVARSEVPWGDKDVYLVRLPFDQEEAPVAAGVVPMHNLIETSAMARQLMAERSPSIWLVCADVAFSDLASPELDPGAAAWGPTYFGVRIGRSR
ncbi:HEAT repeat domain-containing protein [Sorangium sp. So ce341]|uniref:HEAT repeat domain-containing protein n=1 Tax=Sorangium sp. So ce341 TaxID=3133302 RepID=UPI003F600F93